MEKSPTRCNSGCFAFLGFLLTLLAGASAPAADLSLAVTPRWGQGALAVPSSVQTNEAKQAVRVTRLAMLVSGVTLRRADGSAVALEGQFGFLDAESGRLTATFRSVPAGAYAALEFNVGVPAATNHGDPAKWPAGHPLNPLTDALHWSWQGGYVFLALEGRWQAAGKRDPAGERGFLYHLATDERLMRVRFRADFEVAGDTTIDLAFDVARILGAQTLAADDGSESTHSAANDPLAPTLAFRAARAWFWLGAKATSARGRERERVGAGERTGESPLAGARSHDTPGTPFAFVVPPAFPQPELPADNPLTAEGIALGETLFNDQRLSANRTQSCASCHAPKRAFSDMHRVSIGAEGNRGTRNSPPLVNLAWNSNFAWDGSQPKIRDQARAAWTSPIEMHADVDEVVTRLANDGGLTRQFAAAFGSPEVTSERVTLALEQFLLAQVSADSRFDRSLRGAAELTEEEKRGFELFSMEHDPAHGRRGADCFHCHGGPLFSDFAMKNTGLDLISADLGREKVTGQASDHGKFKTPSLRNVAVTAPYMHDGRFNTLEDVVAHYDHGVQRSPQLDPNLAKHPDDGMKFSAADQKALVAFLNTLTDQRFERKGTMPGMGMR